CATVRHSFKSHFTKNEQLMPMIRLHSKLTFFRKYILSTWFSLLGILLLIVTIRNKDWIALIFVLLVFSGFIYAVLKFAITLRSVYLNSSENKIMVNYKNEVLEIPINNI